MAPYRSAAGWDLTPLVERGDAVLTAWLPDYAPMATLRQFRAVRTHQSTCYRLMLPVGPSRLL
jgi:hypothetical protein